jgi:hypothetical protein
MVRQIWRALCSAWKRAVSRRFKPRLRRALKVHLGRLNPHISALIPAVCADSTGGFLNDTKFDTGVAPRTATDERGYKERRLTEPIVKLARATRPARHRRLRRKAEFTSRFYSTGEGTNHERSADHLSSRRRRDVVDPRHSCLGRHHCACFLVRERHPKLTRP